MSFKKIKKEIEDWQETMQNMDAQFNALDRVLGLSYESPFFNAITKMQSKYTKAVARSVGDESDWLLWYWMDNDFGENCLAVKIDGKELLCSGSADIAAIIEKTQQ